MELSTNTRNDMILRCSKEMEQVDSGFARASTTKRKTIKKSDLASP